MVVMEPVVDVIDRGAAMHPERVAVVSGRQRLAYGELRSWSDAIAADLVAAGVGADHIVPLYAERSVAMIPALIGIMKAGAAYLPLDHRYPAERIQRLAALATSPVHLIAGDVPGIGEPVSTPIFVGESRTTGRFVRPAQRSTRAYVVATSGSSGLPKPVVTTHDNLSNFIAGFAEAIGFAPDDVVLARTSLSFDPHTVETLLPLTLGGQTVVLPDEACADPDAIRSAVTEHGVTVVQATPSLWRTLTSGRWKPPLPLKALCGGEPMSPTMRDAILDIPETRLWNVYGPTETTVWCSALEMTRASPIEIGPPIHGLHLEVRDPEGNTINDVGQVGELHIAGRGLAEGYLGAPNLTADRFVNEDRPAPFDRWYRTGDLVRICEQGRMEFRGRADRQVKIRGYRIELDEVEQSVASCPGVKTATIVVDPENATLVACLVSDQPGADEVAVVRRVREHLSRELPAHLRPARYVVLDAIPLTPTEKVDAGAILLHARGTQTPHADVGSESDVASIVRSIWREITGTSDIGDRDLWQDVGGNSLSMIDLRARLAQATGVDVPVSLLTLNATVEGMSLLVEDGRSNALATAPVGEPSPHHGDVPLVPSQLRFLVETPAAHADENVLDVLLRIPLRASRVLPAVQHIINTHDVFRVSSIDAERRVQTLAQQPVSQVIDATDLHASAEAFVEEAPGRRSRLAVAGPLSEWWIYETAEAWSYVHACLHHLVCDELSLHALKLELSSLLAEPAGVLPASASITEWVEHFGSAASRTRFRTLLPTWEHHTSNSEVDPSIVARAGTIGTGQRVELTLPPTTMNDLAARDRRRLLLAAGVHATGEVLGLENVGCRVVDSGRGLSIEIDDSFTIGWLAHHYPLTVRRGQNPASTLMEVDAAHETLWDRGQSYLWLRHVEDVAQLRNAVQLHELPLYFNYVPQMSELDGVMDVSRLLPERPQRGSNTGFALVVRETGHRIQASVLFDSQRLPTALVENFERAFADALVQLIAGGSQVGADWTEHDQTEVRP